MKISEAIRRGMVAMFVFLGLVFGLNSLALAESSEDTWYVQVMLNAWLAGVNGNLEVGNQRIPVDADFGDILEHLDGAIGGRLEGGYKDVALMVDGTYLKTSSTITSVGPLGGIRERGATLETTLIDFGLYYLFFGHRPLMKDGWSMGAEAFVGGRYFGIEDQIFFAGPLVGFAEQGGTDLLDPLLGARLSADLIGNLFVQAEGQVGGFGASSDLTWTASGMVGYGFFQLAVLSAGYKAVGIDYDNDQVGAAYDGLDAILHGPQLSMGVHF